MKKFKRSHFKRSSKLVRTRTFTEEQKHAYRSAKLWGKYFLHAAFPFLGDFSLASMKKVHNREQVQPT